MKNDTVVSVLDLFIDADFIIKCVIIVLILLSIMTWAIFIDRIIKMKAWESYNKKINDLLDSDVTMEVLKNFINLATPTTSLILIGEKMLKTSSNESDLRNKLDTSMKAKIGQISIECNVGIPTLQIVSSISPFIGLFGTIWGIMKTFRNITGNMITFNTVSSGLYEALFITAMGIIVAIFANIFSGVLLSITDNFMINIDSIKLKLSNIIMDTADTANHNSVNNLNDYNDTEYQQSLNKMSTYMMNKSNGRIRFNNQIDQLPD